MHSRRQGGVSHRGEQCTQLIKLCRHNNKYVEYWDLYLFLSVVARSGKTPLCAVLNPRGYYQIHLFIRFVTSSNVFFLFTPFYFCTHVFFSVSYSLPVKIDNSLFDFWSFDRTSYPIILWIVILHRRWTFDEELVVLSWCCVHAMHLLYCYRKKSWCSAMLFLC